MSEKQDPPKVEPAVDDKGTADPPKPPADDDTKRLRSELDGVHKEAQRWKADAEKAQAALAKREAADKKAVIKAAEEAGNFEELLKASTEENATLKGQLEQLARKAVISEAKAKLGDVRGINARDRLAEKWAARDEKERTDEAWTYRPEKEKSDDTDEFTAPATKVHDKHTQQPHEDTR